MRQQPYVKILPGLSSIVTHGCHTLGAGCDGILATNVSMVIPLCALFFHTRKGMKNLIKILSYTSNWRLEEVKIRLESYRK